MFKKYWLTNEDAFFLTFLGAWTSVRTNLWSNPIRLAVLVLTILSFVMVISQIRFTLNESPSNGKRIIHINAVIGTFFVLLSIIFFAIFGNDYLNASDGIILILIAAIWILYTGIESITKEIEYTIERNKKATGSTPTNTSTSPSEP